MSPFHEVWVNCGPEGRIAGGLLQHIVYTAHNDLDVVSTVSVQQVCAHPTGGTVLGESGFDLWHCN